MKINLAFVPFYLTVSFISTLSYTNSQQISQNFTIISLNRTFGSESLSFDLLGNGSLTGIRDGNFIISLHRTFGPKSPIFYFIRNLTGTNHENFESKNMTFVENRIFELKNLIFFLPNGSFIGIRDNPFNETLEQFFIVGILGEDSLLGGILRGDFLGGLLGGDFLEGDLLGGILGEDGILGGILGGDLLGGDFLGGILGDDDILGSDLLEGDLLAGILGEDGILGVISERDLQEGLLVIKDGPSIVNMNEAYINLGLVIGSDFAITSSNR